MRTDQPSSSAPSPEPTRPAVPQPPPPYDAPPPRPRLIVPVIAAVVFALAGYWVLTGARGLGGRPLLRTLQPLAQPAPIARDAGSTPASASPQARRGERAGVLIVLRDGRTLISVDRAGGVMGLMDRSDETMRLVAQVLTDGVLPRPAGIEGLVTSAGATLASSVPDLTTRPIEPVGTVVRDPRPTLRWRPRLKASSYRVVVSDEQGRAVQTNDAVRGTSWTLPTALTPGATYAWTVIADVDAATSTPGSAAPAASSNPAAVTAGASAADASARPSTTTASKGAKRPARAGAGSSADAGVGAGVEPARFRVLDAATVRALDARLERAGRSNLLRGLAFMQAGLLGDAEQAFNGLAVDNEGSQRVRGIVEDVRAMRGAPVAGTHPSGSAAATTATAAAASRVK